MTNSCVIILPVQEFSVLQSAAEQSPYFAHLLKQLPGLKVALAHPLPDLLAEVADGAREAISQVRANTNYPEDWDDLAESAAILAKERWALHKIQEAALADYTPPADSLEACPYGGETDNYPPTDAELEVRIARCRKGTGDDGEGV